MAAICCRTILPEFPRAFSPGVASTATFELDLAQMGIKSFLADASIEKPPVASAMFDFEKKFLASANTSQFMTLENWVRRKAPPKGDLLLQMDIEGAEYDVLRLAERELLKRFRIIVIEFHKLDSLLHEIGYKLIKLTFDKLLRDFALVHGPPEQCSSRRRLQGF